MPAPSFILSKTRIIPAPVSEVAVLLLSPSKDSVSKLTSVTNIAIASGDSFKFVSSVPTHIPNPAKFGYDEPSQSKTNTNRFVPADDGNFPANGITTNFTFIETIPMLPFSLMTVRAHISASWTFLGTEESAEDAGKRRVGVYHSAVPEKNVKVQKIRRLSEVERGTEVEEVCAVWCPWGVGAFSKRVTDQSLTEMMQAFADMFPAKN